MKNMRNTMATAIETCHVVADKPFAWVRLCTKSPQLAAFQPCCFHSPKDLELAPERGANACLSGVVESCENMCLGTVLLGGYASGGGPGGSMWVKRCVEGPAAAAEGDTCGVESTPAGMCAQWFHFVNEKLTYMIIDAWDTCSDDWTTACCLYYLS